MTLENCKLYLEEAKDEKNKKFWAERIARKYPESLKEVVKEIEKQKPKKKKEETEVKE